MWSSWREKFTIKSWELEQNAHIGRYNAFIPLHPSISKHILHTVLYTFPKVLTRRICLPIKSFFSDWPSPFVTLVCGSRVDTVGTNSFLVHHKCQRDIIKTFSNGDWCSSLPCMLLLQSYGAFQGRPYNHPKIYQEN